MTIPEKLHEKDEQIHLLFELVLMRGVMCGTSGNRNPDPEIIEHAKKELKRILQ